MSEEQDIRLSVEQVNDYEFRVRFDGTTLADLRTDEAAPLGADAGPNPARLLAAAVANCLLSSLLFALRKFRNSPGPLRATAHARMARNANNRWRIAAMNVELQLADTTATLQHLDRVLTQFEDFCIVTESVRAGIPVSVQVRDGDGVAVHTSTASA